MTENYNGNSPPTYREVCMFAECKMKKFLPFFLSAIFVVFLLAIPALAVHTVTFINDPVNQPDLYVTKTVVSAVDGYEVPDETFTFTIKVQDTVYANEYYTISSGGDYEKYDSDGTPYQTDKYGRFYLKSGQTARFEYIGENVAYEVTEDPSEHFIISPANGVISGYTGNSASSVTFTNTYVPTEITNLPTELHVYKHVLFPENLTAPESPAFTFILTLNNIPYGGEEFDVFDESTGLEIGISYTEADGSFTLKGGQYAVFSQIPTDSDYRIEEIEMDGWHSIGDTVAEGSTTYPLTRADFTNTEASMAVSKRMSDGTVSDVPFTFYLTTPAGSPIADVPYYTYGIDGNRIDEEAIYTEADGSFTLCADQIAVFTGLTLGTKYAVTEAVSETFTLVTPSVNGYENMTVTDSPITLPFVNEIRLQPGALSVTKTVKSHTEYTSPQDDTFTFMLETNASGDWRPVANASYTISDNNSSLSFATSDDGTFTLIRGQQVVFNTLSWNKNYRVTELESGLSKDYLIDGEASQEGILTSEGLSFLFTNIFSPKAELNILKTDKRNGQPMEGISFELYRDANLTKLVASGTTDADGKLLFTDICEGTWYLKEVQTLEGYKLIENPIAITVRYGEDDILEVIVKGDAKLISTSGNQAQISVVNSTSWVSILPTTGGPGSTFLYTLGILGLFMACIIATHNINTKKKGRENA